MIIKVNGADFSNCGIGKITTTITDECKKLASHYSRLKTTENLIPLQGLMDDLGYGIGGGIWSKIDCLFLPLFSTNTSEVAYDIKNLRQLSFRGNVEYIQDENEIGMKLNFDADNNINNSSLAGFNSRLYRSLSTFYSSQSIDVIGQYGVIMEIGGVVERNVKYNINILDDEGNKIETGDPILTPNSNDKVVTNIGRWENVTSKTIKEQDHIHGDYYLFVNDKESITSDISCDILYNESNIGYINLGNGYSSGRTGLSKTMYAGGMACDLTSEECKQLINAFNNAYYNSVAFL